MVWVLLCTLPIVQIHCEVRTDSLSLQTALPIHHSRHLTILSESGTLCTDCSPFQGFLVRFRTLYLPVPSEKP